MNGAASWNFSKVGVSILFTPDLSEITHALHIERRFIFILSFLLANSPFSPVFAHSWRVCSETGTITHPGGHRRTTGTETGKPGAIGHVPVHHDNPENK